MKRVARRRLDGRGRLRERRMQKLLESKVYIQLRPSACASTAPCPDCTVIWRYRQSEKQANDMVELDRLGGGRTRIGHLRFQAGEDLLKCAKDLLLRVVL